MDRIFDNSTVDPSILADRQVGNRRWDPDVGDWVSSDGEEITNTYSLYDDAVVPLHAAPTAPGVPPRAGPSLPPQPITEPEPFDFPEWAEEGSSGPPARSQWVVVAGVAAVGAFLGFGLAGVIGVFGWWLF